MKSVLRNSAILAGSIAVAAAAMVVAYLYAEHTAVGTLRDTAAQRLEVYRGGLIGEIRRYDYLSSVLSLNGDLVSLLRKPDPQAVDKVNGYLEVVARESQASDIYVMDLTGRTVAASNYRRRDSFVGMNFSFRPYFKDALISGNGHYYGMGTVSNEPGYYFASRVYDGEHLIGVATVKVALHSLETSLRETDEIALAVDANGVIFLSSLPAMMFKTLDPMPPATLAQVMATRQYHTIRAFEPVGRLSRADQDDPDSVRFTPSAGFRKMESNALASEYLVLDRPVAGTEWRLVTLTNVAPATLAARNAATTATFASLAMFICGLYVRQHRRANNQRQKAKLDLEQAYDNLEDQVQTRTEELREANKHLEQEISEREKTEAALKNTFEELVHSGKMAALGQMATSITHELNQPLAALQTLSDNAAVLIQRKRMDDAVENLAEISQLVARMGKITGELKSFARKAPPRSVSVDLQQVVEETLSLLKVRLRQEGVVTRTFFPAGPLFGFVDANRLEQVLVNLINNAMDAMRPCADRTLSISLREANGRARIVVSDTGVGLNSMAIDRLFEPFFTTKAAGQGLGLGLPISAEIIKELGGTLSGHNTTEGAEFVVEIPTVKATEAYA